MQTHSSFCGNLPAQPHHASDAKSQLTLCTGQALRSPGFSCTTAQVYRRARHFLHPSGHNPTGEPDPFGDMCLFSLANCATPMRNV